MRHQFRITPDPNGSNQIGCVCTAQGFEFDYVGVIFGRDLVYSGGWLGDRKASEDPVVKKLEKRSSSVKQTYRVLLTRGMKGYYVFFEDEDTRDFFLSRIKTAESQAVSGTRNCDSATHHQRIRFHQRAETE